MLAWDVAARMVGTLNGYSKVFADGAIKLLTRSVAFGLLRAGYARKVKDPELGHVEKNIRDLIHILRTGNRNPSIHELVWLIAVLSGLATLTAINTVYQLLVSICEGVGTPPIKRAGNRNATTIAVMLLALGVGFAVFVD